MYALTKPRALLRESNVSNTTRPSATVGTIITSHATVAHTEPTTPTQLIASTSFDTELVRLTFHSNSGTATDTSTLVNIKTGAAASETTLIPNLMAGFCPAFSPNQGIKYEFPLRIPAGTRLSATMRSVRTNQPMYCIIELFGGAPGAYWVGTGVEAVGANTADSGGTPVTVGTTSDGTLTSIGTNTYDWGYVTMHGTNNGDTAMLGNNSVWDMASGSATTALLSGLDEWVVNGSTTEVTYNPLQGRYYHVEPGTTLYIRGQSSGNAEDLDIIIYGVY